MSILNKLNQAGYSHKSTTSAVTQPSRPASENQHKWYLALCEEKRETPMHGYELLDSSSMHIEITRLRAIPKFSPATPRMVTFLQDMYDDMKIAHLNFAELSYAAASDLIQTTKKIHEKYMADKPSKKQLELLTQMLYCPDVNEAEIMQMPTEWIDELFHLREDLTAIYHIQDVELMKAVKDKIGSTKVAKIKSDFERQIKANQEAQISLSKKIEEFEQNFDLDSLKKTEVGDFIAKYNQSYREWLQTRVSEGQRNLINELLKRNGQEEMDYAALIQFDRDGASKLIETLRTGKVVNFTEKEHEYKKRAQTLEQAHLYFQTELEAMVHRIFVMANFSTDDAKDLLNAPEREFDERFTDACCIATMLNTRESVEAALYELFDEEQVRAFLS